MPKLGLGLGLPTTRVSAAFDPDALAYFTAAGITDDTAKTQINNFVVEIKTLGLWNSFVCWPLISSQNAGTGVTAYSLGGLGNYNGTLNNGPVWEANGVNMETATRNISTGLAINQPFTIFAVFRTFATNGAGTTQRFYGPNLQGSLTKASGSGASAIVNASAGVTSAVLSSSPNTFYGTQVEHNGASSTASVNGGVEATYNLGTSNNPGFIIGDTSTRGGFTSFVAVITASNPPLIYSTYKNTLGQNLPLA